MSRDRIYILVTHGFWWGALLFGGVISVLHLLHNRLALVRDSLVLGTTLGLLFGLAVALGCAVAALLIAPFRSARDATSKPPWRALGFGLALFHVPFSVLVVGYGLTYDQIPFLRLSSAAGMAAVLLLLCLLVAAAAVAVSFPCAAVLYRAGDRLGRRGAWKLLAAMAALHVAIPVGFTIIDRPRAASDSAVRPLRAPERSDQRVFFVGLDGADWRVIDRLLADGELPTFQHLIREGARADLATLSDANSASIWASIYTGKTPAAHGCHDFYKIRLALMKGGGVYPVHRTFFKEAAGILESLGLAQRRIINRGCLDARPIWEVLDDLRLGVGVVDGYFYSVPARPLARDDNFLFSYALNVLGETGGDLDEDGRSALVQPPEAARLFVAGEDFEWQSKTMLNALAERAQPDYLQLYTHQPDTVQHQTWRWWEPEKYFGVSHQDIAEQRRELIEIHRDFDRFLGRALEVLDKKTTLIIASDHGHSPTLVHRLDTQHRHGPPGVLLMAGPDVRPGVTLDRAHILDLAPTILHLLGLPVARDFDGEVLRAAFTPESKAAAQPRRVDSYEPFGEAVGEVEIEQRLNEKEIEKLRALGYIL